MSVVFSSSEPDKPARFSGINPVKWIVEIQAYFDYYEFSESDRLFYVRLFFDYPATEWLREYRSSNPNSSWQEFLDAIYYNFDPIGIESAEMRILLNRMMETVAYLAKKEVKVEESSAQMVDETTLTLEEIPPAESEADLIEGNTVEAVEAEKIEENSVVAKELVEAEAKPQSEAVKKSCGDEATPIKEVEKALLCLTTASDGRAIPLRIDVTLFGFLQKNGVRIFDPGIFYVSILIRYGTLEDFTAGSYFFYPP